jgi:CRP-like cAMP-binding protein
MMCATIACAWRWLGRDRIAASLLAVSLMRSQTRSAGVFTALACGQTSRVVCSTPDVRGNVLAVFELLKNQVLARVPKQTLEALETNLRRESMQTWQVLCAEHEPITRVYFPIDAVISIVSPMEDGSIAESYTAGRDGIAGWEVLYGDERIIFRTMCQIPGVCYSMDAAEFCELARGDPDLAAVVRAYTHCLTAMSGRSGACNLLHPLAERCARWLLTSHDRVAKTTFELTQEIMATMLGVHRPSVSIAAGTLQKAGAIMYSRGRVTVTDRARLEEASCECYRIVADEFCRVLGGPQPQAA